LAMSIRHEVDGGSDWASAGRVSRVKLWRQMGSRAEVSRVKLGVGPRPSRKSGSRSPTSLLLGSFTKRLSSVLHATPRSLRDLFKIARNASAESQLPEFGSSREASKKHYRVRRGMRNARNWASPTPRADLMQRLSLIIASVAAPIA
jgi:hypothetical protein